jgi:hypothetical protein
MINFYRRFIEKYAENLQPLNELLKGAEKDNAPIGWSGEIQDSFSEPKRYGASASDGSGPATTFQQYTWQPLGLSTKSMIPAQRKCSAYDGELLAMCNAVKRFRHAVEGRDFAIYRDRKRLTYAFSENFDTALTILAP